MASISTYPVIIIGCGPAGMAASLFLSKAGIRHLLLEKSTYPRDKICGDGCSGKTTYVLKRYNPALVDTIFHDEERFLPSYGVTFAAPNGKAIDIPFYTEATKGQRPPGFTSKRLELDNFLYQQLDRSVAELIEGVDKITLEKAEAGYRLHFRVNKEERTVQCQLIIGADGDKGFSRKYFMQDAQLQKSDYIGIRGYYDGVRDLHPENFIELHFLKATLPGYFWIFPLPNGQANVGLGMRSDAVRQKKINLREVMMQAIRESPTISARFKDAQLIDKIYGWGLPMATEPQSITGDHYMLTGDAAALIDPFTGEGIGNALYSGMIAAEAAEAAVRAGDFSADFLRVHYEKVLYGKLGAELKLSYSMQKMVRFPWLFNLVVNKAKKSRELQHTLTAMFADLDMRAKLKQPSFYWKILRNR